MFIRFKDADDGGKPKVIWSDANMYVGQFDQKSLPLKTYWLPQGSDGVDLTDYAVVFRQSMRESAAVAFHKAKPNVILVYEYDNPMGWGEGVIFPKGFDPRRATFFNSKKVLIAPLGKIRVVVKYYGEVLYQAMGDFDTLEDASQAAVVLELENGQNYTHTKQPILNFEAFDDTGEYLCCVGMGHGPSERWENIAKKYRAPK